MSKYEIMPPEPLEPMHEASLWLTIVAASYIVGMVSLVFAMGVQPLIVASVMIGGQWLIRIGLLARDHHLGVLHANGKRYHKAIECFRRSYFFFSRHSLLDDLRPITLLSISSITFREEAVLYAVACHARLGEFGEARELLDEGQRAFPNSDRIVGARMDLEELVRHSVIKPVTPK